MVVIHSRPKRKHTGGRYKKYGKKKLHEMGSLPTNTKLEERRFKKVNGVGSTEKFKLLGGDEANLYDPKTKKYSKVKIKTAIENPANRHFVRRNILTKGAIVETEKGKARITSRPGQDGIINAVLV